MPKIFTIWSLQKKIFADPLSSTHTQRNTEYKIWLEKDWYGGLCALAGSSLKWTTSFFLKKIIYLHRVLVAACGIQFPDQGTLLASGSPGNSLSAFLTRAVINHYSPTPPPLDDYMLFLGSKLLFLLWLLSPTPMPTKPTNSVCPVTERTAPRIVGLLPPESSRCSSVLTVSHLAHWVPWTCLVFLLLEFWLMYPKRLCTGRLQRQVEVSKESLNKCPFKHKFIKSWWGISVPFAKIMIPLPGFLTMDLFLS